MAKKQKQLRRAQPSAEPRKLEQKTEPVVASQQSGRSIAQANKKFPSVVTLFKRSVGYVWNNRRVFVWICAIYLLLNLLLVRGFSSGTNIAELKQAIAQEGGNPLLSGLALFTVLVTTDASSGQAASAYQSFVFIITSLAIIWALRKVWAAEAFRARDAYYKGMYPLVPFLLVLLVIGLQLLPLLLGGALYALIVGNGIAANGIELAIVALVFFGLGLLSLYLIASSLMALYIVALPDMTPIKALRSAKQLVKGRRWIVLRKLLFLPLALLVAGALLLLPIILLVPVLAPWVFFGATAVSIVIGHSYCYTVYRELLP
ncbi:MAG TPA: hypothetical protein VK983_05185 [Candidatus Limnocylindrales bacterium]|nr:hypothetical protein [Candidatus Limnocylindrales bacterium]